MGRGFLPVALVNVRHSGKWKSSSNHICRLADPPAHGGGLVIILEVVLHGSALIKGAGKIVVVLCVTALAMYGMDQTLVRVPAGY